MQIFIRGQDVLISDALVAHCVDRARREFQRFSSGISHAEFAFVDLNGAKRGSSHACRVTVDLSDGSQVQYEGRAGDFYRSVTRAIDGSARYIQDKLKRRDGNAGGPASVAPPAP